jgi:hypothetical protein
MGRPSGPGMIWIVATTLLGTAGLNYLIRIFCYRNWPLNPSVFGGND